MLANITRGWNKRGLDKSKLYISGMDAYLKAKDTLDVPYFYVQGSFINWNFPKIQKELRNVSLSRSDRVNDILMRSKTKY